MSWEEDEEEQQQVPPLARLTGSSGDLDVLLRDANVVFDLGRLGFIGEVSHYPKVSVLSPAEAIAMFNNAYVAIQLRVGLLQEQGMDGRLALAYGLEALNVFTANASSGLRGKYVQTLFTAYQVRVQRSEREESRGLFSRLFHRGD